MVKYVNCPVCTLLNPGGNKTCQLCGGSLSANVERKKNVTSNDESDIDDDNDEDDLLFSLVDCYFDELISLSTSKKRCVRVLIPPQKIPMPQPNSYLD